MILYGVGTMVKSGDREVQLWLASISEQVAFRSRLVGLLSADERKRAAAFTGEEPRRSFVVGRGMLRLLLGEYLGREPSEVKLTTNAWGKPELAPEQGSCRKAGLTLTRRAASIHFNVSHSGDLVLIGLSPRWEVGVDVERVRAMEIGSLFPLCLAPEESAAVERMPEQARLRRFYDLWTRKEALAKAIGLGIALPLREIVFTESAGRQPRHLEAPSQDSGLTGADGGGAASADLVLASAPEAAGDPRRWRILPVAVGEGYAASVAVRDPAAQIRLRRFGEG